MKDDSWLFDYKNKESTLRKVFDKAMFFSYSNTNMVKIFMEKIGYSVKNDDLPRLNVTKTT